MARWYAERAWLPDGPAASVVVEAEGARITAVRPDSQPPADAARLPGLVVPGLANAHSHAFHRALRGRTEGGTGTFWSWREAMYEVAAHLDPGRYLELARAVFAEMALAGITAVGEFHYLHHRPGGRPYDDPNAMQAALAQAAADVGIRITLLDTCYLRGGFGQPLDGVQQRFGDRDADAWAARASARRAGDHVRLGAAIHSVRAVDPEGIEVVGRWAAEHDTPLHVHVSEQPAENEACVAYTGRTPTALLAEHGALEPHTTAVHATHLTDEDIATLGDTRTGVCLCPTTERVLADGIGPAARLRAAGSPLSVGSDSHAFIDLFEEMRAIELNERLATLRRGSFQPEALLAAATEDGMRALGWPAGAIAPGRLCDLVAIDTRSVRLAGFDPEHAAAFVAFAGTAADVTHVVASGRLVVAERRHLGVADVPERLASAIAAVTAR